MHIEGCPELISVAKESIFGKIKRKLRSVFVKKKYATNSEPSGCYNEFVVEVPADVDISEITNIKPNGLNSRLWFNRVNTLESDLPDDVNYLEEVL